MEVISIHKVLKTKTRDEITVGVSTDAAPTWTFTSWVDEEDPARKNERKQPELQKKNQASTMSWKPTEQKYF